MKALGKIGREGQICAPRVKTLPDDFGKGQVVMPKNEIFARPD